MGPKPSAWLCLWLAVLLAGAAKADPHDPIRIASDDEFCVPGSGVINCEAADGSPEAPYIIQGWTIDADACAPSCATPEPCPDRGPALLAVCGTTKEVVIRGVTVDGAGWPDAAVSENEQNGLVRTTPIALLIDHEVGMATLQDVVATAATQALWSRGDIVVQSTAIGTAAGSPSETSISSAVYLAGGHASFSDVVVKASGHTDAIIMRSLDETPGSADLRRVEMRGPTSLSLLLMNDYNATVTDSRFVDAVSGGRDILFTGALEARGGSLEAIGNDFTDAMTGITLEGTQATIRWNTFAHANGHAVLTRGAPDSSSCGVQAHYNDFIGVAVGDTVQGSDCPIDARFNFWDGAPRTEGDVDTDPPLPFSIQDMPGVSITDWEVRDGDLFVEGATSGSLDRVEIRIGQTVANASLGAGSFSAAVDLGKVAFGDQVAAVQACIEQFCGRPETIAFQHSPTLLPPIAVLSASPLVAAPGDEVLLDGSGSFSPQGTSITEYQFGERPWQAEATLSASAGNTWTLRVRDANGLESANATAFIHVREPSGQPEAQVQGTPAAPLAPLVLALLALGARRRTH